MKTSRLLSTLALGTVLTASSAVFAQVKIGTSPTTISANVNLEVQATNNHRTVIRQDNGFVGIGTITPNAHLNVEAGNMSVSNGADNTFDPTVLGAASIGRGNINRANWAVSIGQENAVAGIRSLAVGYQNSIPVAGDHSFVVGQSNMANAINSFAGGNGSVTSGSTSMAFGLTARASGAYAISLGRETTASGTNSIAAGYSAVAGGSASVAMGNDVSASDIGAVSLGWLTQANGPASVALGYACFAQQNASIAIGNNARANHADAFVFSDNSSGGVAIGSWADNTMTMRFGGGYRFYTNGSHTTGVQLTPGDVTWGAISDIRTKEDISDIESGVATIMQLRPKKYHYKKAEKKHFSLGFIAQEMVKVLPDIVNVPEDKEDFLSIRYTELVPVLTKAIQEQQAEIKEQQAEIDVLKARLSKMDALEAKLAAFEAKLETAPAANSASAQLVNSK
ncbi:tail fiber domain-containing protein [Dyadobacter sp. 676]|uniref:Tail fiber domain-containing protein n=1 Tax=Dyadobacter sp. 676 TaxID=3088362 RepID=A0AAU8FGI5_9BACT